MDRPLPSDQHLRQSSSISLLSTQLPHDALCHYYNIVVPQSTTGVHKSKTVDLAVLARDAHAPTHVLAFADSDENASNPEYAPLLAPINAKRFIKGFHTNAFLPKAAADSLVPPIPHYPSEHSSTSVSALVVTLPVIPILVPHPPSLPLLLLFGMRLEKQLNLLAWRLLPSSVIVEFPHAAGMAQIFANTKIVDDAEFQRCYARTHGLWKNVLALAPRDTKIVELIQIVWNVTAEAKRLRNRTLSPPSSSASARSRSHSPRSR